MCGWDEESSSIKLTGGWASGANKSTKYRYLVYTGTGTPFSLSLSVSRQFFRSGSAIRKTARIRIRMEDSDADSCYSGGLRKIKIPVRFFFFIYFQLFSILYKTSSREEKIFPPNTGKTTKIVLIKLL